MSKRKDTQDIRSFFIQKKTKPEYVAKQNKSFLPVEWSSEVDGLGVIPDFVDEETALKLLKEIQGYPWEER
jgi:hypothetical protein